MIVNTDIRDSFDYRGYPCKELITSYIDTNGKIDYLTYKIPPEQMFVWKYAKKNQPFDPTHKSWDFKNVVKEASSFLNEQRIHEIILDLTKSNPNISIIHDLNTPDTCYTDIEVDVDDDGFPDAAGARNPINTISWVHNSDVTVLGRKPLDISQINWIQERIDEHCKTFKTKYKFTYVYCDSEEELLNLYIKDYMTPAHCITGWNIFGYDYPYIMNRCEKKNISTESLSPTNTWFTYKPQALNSESIKLPKHKLLYDYMEIYAKWDESVSPKESNKLDWVSERVLGTKKVVHQLGFKDEWEQKPAEYIFYNAVDSILIRELDIKMKTSAVFMGLANLMHVPALTAFSPVRSLEIVQDEYLYPLNRVFPMMKRDDKKDGQYEGAFVYDPIPGIKRNVICLDYASLYPTTGMQFNISPDTYIKKDKEHVRQPNEIKTASGAVYRKDFKGFIPMIWEDYFAKRKGYKKEMLQAEVDVNELQKAYETRFGKTFDI